MRWFFKFLKGAASLNNAIHIQMWTANHLSRYNLFSIQLSFSLKMKLYCFWFLEVWQTTAPDNLRHSGTDADMSPRLTTWTQALPVSVWETRREAADRHKAVVWYPVWYKGYRAKSSLSCGLWPTWAIRWRISVCEWQTPEKQLSTTVKLTRKAS